MMENVNSPLYALELAPSALAFEQGQFSQAAEVFEETARAVPAWKEKADAYISECKTRLDPTEDAKSQPPDAETTSETAPSAASGASHP
jgi:hypothetical protein